MPHQSHAHLRFPRVFIGALTAALLALSIQVVAPRLTPRAEASAGTLLCVGFSGCQSAGMSNSGYHQHWGTMYWRMYSGRNCVNYAAYRMVAAGMPNVRPWSGSGNAMNWGVAMSSITDSTPRVGAIAWWRANAPGAGSLGHVAYVERVISPTQIVVSESNWGSDFDWREVSTSNAWPSGFIHFVDRTIVNTKAPAVIGKPTVEVPITVSGGGWSPRATLSYQWLVGGVAAGTAPSYTPGYQAYGKKVQVRVTAAARGYQTTSKLITAGTTAAGTLKTGALPQIVGAPSAGQPATPIVGSPIVGQPLVASGERFGPAVTGRSYQWYAAGQPIKGATGRTFTPTDSQVGQALTVAITGSHAGYNPLTLTSAATAPVLEPIVAQEQPASLTGNATWRGRMHLDPGTFSAAGTVTVAYQWERDGQPITGATHARYPLVRADVGHLISVQVTASAPHYRDLVTTYDVPTRITTPSRFYIHHTTTPGAARVTVMVGAPGTQRADVVGTLTVRLGKTVQTVSLVHGYAVFNFSHLAGRWRTLAITYSGSGVILGRSWQKKIWIALPKKKPVHKAAPTKTTAKSAAKSTAK